MTFNNNLTNDKTIRILLIIALSLSSYGTFTNTQLDNSVDKISSNLEAKLDIIMEAKKNEQQLYETLANTNTKLEYNNIELQITKNKLDMMNDDIKALKDDINSIKERVARVEARINIP